MNTLDKIIKLSPEPSLPSSEGRVLAVGTFDGVHIGHHAVLETVLSEATAHSLKPAVMTFDRHPLLVIAPDRAPDMLSLPEHRLSLLKEFVSEVFTLHFNEQVAAITTKDWMRWLNRSLNVQTLIVGYDNTFGSDGITMEVSDYVELGRQTGIKIIEAPYVDNVSSSHIRKATSQGNVKLSAQLLGRPFSLTGTVVRGHHIGTSLGWPTANIVIRPGMQIPGNGVYAAKAIHPDGTIYDSTVNIGSRPTVSDSGNVTIEAHLHNFSGSLYGLDLTLEFYDKIRDEKKFNSLDELAQAIAADKELTTSLLSTRDNEQQS